MKKIFLTTITATLFLMGNHLFAQDCEAIVAPYLRLGNIDRAEYPQPKFEWRCNFSHNTFFVTDQITEGATVFSISALRNLITDKTLPSNYSVNLETFSYWAYNFMDFQSQDYHRTIYFETPGSEHRYLGVRCWDEAYDRTEFPENYKQEQ